MEFTREQINFIMEHIEIAAELWSDDYDRILEELEKFIVDK